MDFASVKQWTIPEGDVSKVIDSNENVIWSKEVPDLSSQFYMENTSSTRYVGLVFWRSSANPTLQKSTDGITWTTLCSTDGENFSIPPNTKYYVRSTGFLNPTTINVSSPNNTRITSYEDPTVYGNQPALKLGGNIGTIYNTVISPNTSTSQDFLFYRLFAYNKEVYDISDLDFNIDSNKFSLNSFATTSEDLGLQYTFANMFYNCTNLSVMPTKIAKARGFMKYSASKLTFKIYAPNYYYYRMFEGCTSITSTPWICTEVTESYTPTIISDLCGNYTYSSMFSGCTSLNEIKVSNGRSTSNFTITIFGNNCTGSFPTKTSTTSNIFYNVGSSGIFKIPSSLRSSNYSLWNSFVPSGWTVVEV